MYENCPQCKVDGEPVDLKRIRLRSMNFGQHWRTPGIINLPYHFISTLQSVLPLLKRELPDFIEDAQEFPSENDPLEEVLRKNNWLIDLDAPKESKNRQVIQIAVDYYAHEILFEAIGDARLAQPGFVLNTIDKVVLEKDLLLISGTCRASQTPVVYQDI